MNPTTAPLAAAALSGVFVNNIAAMNDGEVINDIDDALRQATNAAFLTKKAAKVKIVLTIEPAGEGVGGTPLYRVVDDITCTLPKKKRNKTSVFFADDDGNLTRRNPRQEEMQLQTITGGKSDSASPAVRTAGAM